MKTLRPINWRAVLTATRNLFTLVGMIAVGAWIANSFSWFATASAAILLSLLWWTLYRLAIAWQARQWKSESRRVANVERRLRHPGKRAQASWKKFAEELREEATDRANANNPDYVME